MIAVVEVAVHVIIDVSVKKGPSVSGASTIRVQPVLP